MDAGMYTQAFSVTPSDTVSFPNGYVRGLYIGVTGDVTAIVGGSPVLFKAVPVGLLHVECTRVNATGTTATNILGMN